MTTAIAQSLSAALLHFVWQGLLVAFLLWVALFLLRKRSANSRYVASCIALGLLAVIPVITAAVLYTRTAEALPGGERLATVSLTTAMEAAGVMSPGSWLAGWQSWIIPAWSIGVLLFSIRLVWGCKQVSSLRRRGTPADLTVLAIVTRLAAHLGLDRRVRVLITSAADGPSVVGWIRPVILLPSATLLGLTPDQLEAVLAHELAHIRRHDYMVNVLQILAETLLFYHPAVWWISSRIRQERELCCDDLAVSLCGDAMCYARALTKLERLRVMSPSMAMAGAGGPLLYRIERLVGANTQEYGPSKLPGILALCLGLVCFAINAHRAGAQEQEAGRKFAIAYRMEGHMEKVRDGAGVSVDLGAAAILHRTSVEYPHSAIEKKIQGTVLAEATLDGSGDVTDARILSGPAELRRSALQSVLQWHFLPDGTGTRQVSIAYQLAEAEAAGHEKRALTFTTRGPQLEWRANTYEFTPGVRVPEEEEARRLAEGAQVLRQKLEQARSVEGSAENQQATETRRLLEDQMKELELKTVDIHRERGAVWEHATGPHAALGRRLARIDALGLSDQVRQGLVSRLPVHIGDTLSEQLFESTVAAVQKFDEHLNLDVIKLENGDIALRIIAPE